MLTPSLTAKFQRILVSSSPAEYLGLTNSERALYEQWRVDITA